MHSGINMSGAIGLRSYHTLPFAAPRHALQHSARQLKCCSLSRDSVTTLVKVLSQQGASQLPVVVSTLTTVWQHVEPLVARAKPQLQACLSVVACLSLSMIAAALLKTCGIGWRTATIVAPTRGSTSLPDCLGGTETVIVLLLLGYVYKLSVDVAVMKQLVHDMARSQEDFIAQAAYAQAQAQESQQAALAKLEQLTTASFVQQRDRMANAMLNRPARSW